MKCVRSPGARWHRLLAIAALTQVAFLVGCGTVQRGSEDKQARLKSFSPVSGMTSLYVCRENALWLNAGVTTKVLVDAKDIGTVRPNMFVHAVVPPGKHTLTMKNDGIAGVHSPQIDIETAANEVLFLWIGGGFGYYTIDHFRSPAEGMACVRDATYAVPAQAAL